ncbi:MAG: glycine cleavage system aminomethyltransferase GcvT [Verrucomicrobia bacterium]|jgi:aminomethyltransferase|nr:MAG: glycine cleavage system aminomethyltransferase GcvT [Verrucomicrobiota bacterium]
MSELKRTPLRDFHASHGARLVDFAGWEMPVQYRSILDEHKAVRHSVGLFDVSHMGEVDIKGIDTQKFINHLITNNIEKMTPGRIVYSPMCYPDGGVVDDLLVYKKADDDFFLCINAGNIDKDVTWIKDQAKAFTVSVTDRSADYALIAVQGPLAAALVQSLTGAKLGLIKYYHFSEGTVAGIHCIISRTGYTGEDGFELYHAQSDSVALTEAVVAAGVNFKLELCGLGSRDSLRLEAGYPLYGHEITHEISPLTAGLGWTVKLDKPLGFIGSDALKAEKLNGSSKQIVFFRTGDRRIIRAEASVIDATGTQQGKVASGTLSPILNEAIGTALVNTEALKHPLFVEVRGERLALQLVKAPFVPLKKVT